MKTQISKALAFTTSSLLAALTSAVVVASVAASVMTSIAPSTATAAPKSGPKILCRDCPFPMKVADGVWIMPNEKIEVTIERIKLPSRFEEVHVVLRDPETHAVLAAGISKQRAGRKTVNVQLFDNSGRQVQGFVRFMDPQLDAIQARFTCEQCEIGKLLD
ncbi:MAG: hypothetical protein EOP05_09980 [Proteobacteria bacterium]|nr:MAG: hypothetical protein EOP05_09980 [Pseudomonadota bacterium]